LLVVIQSEFLFVFDLYSSLREVVCVEPTTVEEMVALLCLLFERIKVPILHKFEPNGSNTERNSQRSDDSNISRNCNNTVTNAANKQQRAQNAAVPLTVVVPDEPAPRMSANRA